MKKIFLFAFVSLISLGVFSQTFDQANKLLQDKKYSEAALILKMMAANGDAESAAALGNLYIEGLGVSKNYADGFFWHLEAAKKGIVSSQYVAADFYSNGIGTQRDDSLAFEWMSKASIGGNCSAISNMSLMYLIGSGTKINNEMAYYWALKLKKTCPQNDNRWLLAKISISADEIYKIENVLKNE